VPPWIAPGTTPQSVDFDDEPDPRGALAYRLRKEIAKQLGVGRVQVVRWRERYVEPGLEGIERDLPRRRRR
jgi:hypothetical protein